MKIITWNCNMAFRKKADLILSYQPDILIIPECEHPGKLIFGNETAKPTDSLWFGKNLNKGIGIFSYTGFRFKVLKNYNEDLQLVIPILVSSKEFQFKLFAIWANNPTDPDGQYVTQVWKAIRHYNGHLRSKQTMLIGDFNSNSIWDKPRREGNHSTVVQKLASKDIHSVYHRYFNQDQGKEKHPTFYLYKQKDKAYHIDYCFASEAMMEHLKSVEVGAFEFWKKHSDHVPVIVSFDDAIYKNNGSSKTSKGNFLNRITERTRVRRNSS